LVLLLVTKTMRLERVSRRWERVCGIEGKRWSPDQRTPSQSKRKT
jgi:hypothetical protein